MDGQRIALLLHTLDTGTVSDFENKAQLLA
jgi:hypothetical protein